MELVFSVRSLKKIALNASQLSTHFPNFTANWRAVVLFCFFFIIPFGNYFFVNELQIR